MSLDFYICCLDCKEEIHVGQNGYIYTSSDMIAALDRFLSKHTTWNVPRGMKSREYHELVYMPEPYNSFISDYDDSWTEEKWPQ